MFAIKHLNMFNLKIKLITYIYEVLEKGRIEEKKIYMLENTDIIVII